MAWIVELHNSVTKQLPKLPSKIVDRLLILLAEIEVSGAVRGNWPNYSKLEGCRHHCHLKKGHPTYVAVWTEDKETVTVEVIYVGTHEKAPY
ncbi:MAG: cytotoxic translational repressor of toxin-antitoxin stability system [Geobacteraceae bacterium]|nr:cytotoxic translational repressor of toxin-antitoxin stability system [Geobacteraceae bacterium]